MDQESSGKQPAKQLRGIDALEGLGIGLFALIAGALLMAEQFGWISADLKWGGPLVLIVFGATVLIRLAKRK